MSLVEEIKKEIRDIQDFPKEGVLFKDITPIFYNSKLCSKIAEAFINRMPQKPDAVVGIESRGFLFGFLTANKLGVPFILVRKEGKLPYKTIKHKYDLEYGSSTIEIHQDALKPNDKVIIHDDLLATGGTAEAAANLVKKLGAIVLGYNFVIGLDFLKGEQKLKQHSNNITCLVHY
ncbi:MAG: adenine phosphoribosyltransferase [Bacteroidetes bacterium]|nr:adenine phosphoribosyltransferase [Bacteroidota bacterium]